MKPLAGVGQSVIQYFKGAYEEFRRVTWPNRETVIRYTILVTITIMISALILTVFDYGLQKLSDQYLLR